MDWFSLVQTIGIIAGLLFSTYTLLKDTRATKIQNYLLLTQYHREIWRMPMEISGLERITQKSIPGAEVVLTERERQFLTFIFLHMTCAFELSKSSHVINIEKDKHDIGEMMELPLFKAFWKNNKKYYNEDFKQFITSATQHSKSENPPKSVMTKPKVKV